MNWFKVQGLRFKVWLRRVSGAEAEIETLRLANDQMLVQAQGADALRRRVQKERDALAVQLRDQLQPFGVVDAERAPEWSVADRKELQKFLRSPTGQRLMEAANFQEQAVNRIMVLRVDNAENNTGFARGWHMATRHLLRELSADVQPQSDEDTNPSTGAAGTRERYAP